MGLQKLSISAAAAFFLGIAQCYFLIFCWAYIAAYSPLFRWLFQLGLRESIRIVLFSIDFLTSIVLSLPVAYALIRLRPIKLGLYLPLAIVPGFIWLNRNLVGSSFFIEHPEQFILGWVPELLALPCAVWTVRSIAKRVAPN